ncbi:tRNA pseudouridine(38-40) synthase TruA [bacterium AH-315-E10]|nr:tRNA pseudouridine(38-40) synthase TruA [bacterium AH-315-E10]
MAPSSSTPESGARQFHLIIAYNGTAYSGWQHCAGQSTVQGTLTNAIRELYQIEEPVLYASSRTDTGVHALGQSVSFFPPDTPDISIANVKKAISSFLPLDIRIVSVTEAPVDFHARHNALGKIYSFTILRNLDSSPFSSSLAVQEYHELNIPAMEEAAAHLCGMHNFITFSAKAKDKDDSDANTIKRLDRFYFREYGSYLVISVKGNSFMYRMVRRLAGFLIEVGKGRIKPGESVAILNAHERNGPFKTAPPQGLYLERVFYDSDEMNAYEPSQLPFLML